jgi:hypothetical protein
MSRYLKKTVADTWFGLLFRLDKRLFLLIFLFFLFSLLANLVIKLETSPFFIWNMYSLKELPQKYYTLYEIRYNDSLELKFKHTWNEPAKTMLNMPLRTYFSILANDSVSPEETYLRSHWLKKHPAFAEAVRGLYTTPQALSEFPEWFRRYVEKQAGRPVRNVYVVAKKLQFDNHGDLDLLAADTVLSIKSAP